MDGFAGKSLWVVGHWNSMVVELEEEEAESSGAGVEVVNGKDEEAVDDEDGSPDAECIPDEADKIDGE